MNSSILSNIKQWSIENNNPFSCVIYKIDKNFPKAFKDAINYYINSTRSNEENLDNGNEFAIIFTENKNVYLEFLCGRTRVIIIEDNEEYKALPPAKIIRESKFLNDLKYLDNININNFILSLPEEYAHRFTETLTIEEITQKITNNIIDYIKYLVKERDEHIEKIFFKRQIHQ